MTEFEFKYDIFRDRNGEIDIKVEDGISLQFGEE